MLCDGRSDLALVTSCNLHAKSNTYIRVRRFTLTVTTLVHDPRNSFLSTFFLARCGPTHFISTISTSCEVFTSLKYLRKNLTGHQSLTTVPQQRLGRFYPFSLGST